jgi:hypothetical protein
MTTTSPQRRVGPFEVGAVGLGCMGLGVTLIDAAPPPVRERY